MGHYHVVLTTPETSPKTFTLLTVVEMQQLLNIEKTDSKVTFFSYNGEFQMVEEKYE